MAKGAQAATKAKTTVNKAQLAQQVRFVLKEAKFKPYHVGGTWAKARGRRGGGSQAVHPGFHVEAQPGEARVSWKNKRGILPWEFLTPDDKREHQQAQAQNNAQYIDALTSAGFHVEAVTPEDGLPYLRVTPTKQSAKIKLPAKTTPPRVRALIRADHARVMNGEVVVTTREETAMVSLEPEGRIWADMVAFYRAYDVTDETDGEWRLLACPGCTLSKREDEQSRELHAHHRAWIKESDLARLRVKHKE